MGNTLEKPITEKETLAGGGSKDDSTIKWGVSSMQGWRVTMEDAHVASSILSVQEEDGTSLVLKDHFFFAVLDGHGGSTAAEFGSRHLLPTLLQNPHFVTYARMWNHLHPHEAVGTTKKNGYRLRKPRKINRAVETRNHRDEREMITLLRTALEDVVVEVDRQFLKEMVNQGLFQMLDKTKNTATTDIEEGSDQFYPCDSKEFEEKEVKEKGDDGPWHINLVSDHDDNYGAAADTQASEAQLSGTTLTAVLLTPYFCICANLGDSRAVLDSVALSRDHKPTLVDEQKRIEAAGGQVAFGRVEGELAVSRALGDFEFKNYPSDVFDMDIEDLRELAQRLKVSSFPEITIHHRMDPTDQLLVVACDGIWDVLKNGECCEEIRTLMKTEGEANVGLVAEEILDLCLDKGSRDNMSIIVIQFPALTVGRGGGVLKRRSRRLANG